VKHSLGLALGLALTIVASVPAASQNAPASNTPASQKAPVPHHHATQPTKKRHVPAAQSVGPIRPPIGPYLHTGDGDNDGLSRDPDDCNKGCIDGNPG
jgi:hypothetical protein